MGGDRPEKLREFVPRHGFLVGIDSDGCVFDTMEIKQKECFVPATIETWGLQAVARYARETIEFVNLYSKWRGTNRFQALAIEMAFLAERPAVIARGLKLPDLEPLRAWVEAGGTLSNATAKEQAAKTGHSVLQQAVAWSELVNKRIAEMVHGVPPFPGVRECLEELSCRADIIVVSQTPGEALAREWREHGLDRFPAIIAGQEMGTKTDHLRLASDGRYRPHHILMIGDALGDLQAARAAGALFFPIEPGHEEASWDRLYREGLARFFAGQYAGDYEQERIAAFENLLPEVPPWKR